MKINNMEEIKYLIIIQIILFVVGCIALFLESYSTEKGKNQATKEDIGHITEIIETIKTDLQKKTEELKSQIQLRNEHLISLRSFERDAILSYHKSISNLIDFMLRVDPTVYRLDDYSGIDTISAKIQEQFYLNDTAQSQILLFYSAPELLEVISEINKSTINLNLKIMTELISFRNIFANTNIELNFKVRSNEIIYKEFHEKMNTQTQKYYDERNNAFTNLNLNVWKLRKLLYNRLKELFELNG